MDIKRSPGPKTSEMNNYIACDIRHFTKYGELFFFFCFLFYLNHTVPLVRLIVSCNYVTMNQFLYFYSNMYGFLCALVLHIGFMLYIALRISFRR